MFGLVLFSVVTSETRYSFNFGKNVEEIRKCIEDHEVIKGNPYFEETRIKKAVSF